MADSSLLSIRRRAVTGGVSIVSIAGEIDLATADAFRDSLSPYLSDPATTQLVCDMSQVKFLACSGLSVLLDVQSALSARGGQLSVVANGPAVLRPVKVTGLNKVLRVYPHLSAAISQSTVD
ncbi:MAG: anti-sigma factor antagonist [Actinophytocola sp.]|uniref:anti-sigma factor antagonist n=1 Tax=Actinophytocola sp. TaxID=1872138 RepID=UPI003C773A58